MAMMKQTWPALLLV